jgi:hypothetical protein
MAMLLRLPSVVSLAAAVNAVLQLLRSLLAVAKVAAGWMNQ